MEVNLVDIDCSQMSIKFDWDACCVGHVALSNIEGVFNTFTCHMARFIVHHWSHVYLGKGTFQVFCDIALLGCNE